MNKLNKEEISISWETRHWENWIVAGVFTVILALILLNLDMKFPVAW